MRRLTKDETDVIKGMRIMPEDWSYSGKRRPPTAEEVAEWCAENGVRKVKGKAGAHRLLKSIEGKFFPKDPSDGFDEISLEDVATWVLTTYLKREDVEAMSEDETIEFLQDWKYHFGFRKQEGMASVYRANALELFDGRLMQARKSKEIEYVSECHDEWLE